MTTHLNEALRLAELGWAVFALGPTGRPYPNCKPCRETCPTAREMAACPCLLCHGCYAGTTAPEAVTAMWEALPHSLIGIATGAVSGLVVLDFDTHTANRNGLASIPTLRDRGLITRTVTAKTGGGGLHMYFTHPGEPTPNDNRGKLAPGVDVKGDGGFVIAPPSAKRNGLAYSWFPDLSPWEMKPDDLAPEVLSIISKEQRQPQRPGVGVSHNNYDPETVIEKFSEALDILRLTGVGSRNENLYRAACRGGEAIASGTLKFGDVQVSLEEAAREAGMTGRDGIRATIRSGLNRGMADFLREDGES
jgi:hypothetical protein